MIWWLDDLTCFAFKFTIWRHISTHVTFTIYHLQFYLSVASRYKDATATGAPNPWVRLCQAKEDIELWASLEIEGPTANAWYGRGLYTVPLAPDGWENIDAILDAWQRERNGVKCLRCRMCLRWPGYMMAADGTCNMTVFWAMTLGQKLTFTVQSWLDCRSADARNTTLDWLRTTTTATWCDVTCKTRVKSMCRRLIPQGPNIAFPFL